MNCFLFFRSCGSMYVFFISSSAGGHLRCFHLLANVNNAAVHVKCQYHFENLISILLGKYTKVELLASQLVLVSIFWITSVQFSVVTAPFYIPTCKAQDFQFLYILIKICYSLYFFFFSNIHPNRYEMILDCGFNWHLTYGYWFWLPFKHVLTM